ncbi:MAG: hypothetical protein LC116_04010 [Bacteroidetes bacterium]|nr:hypothetical protein [Bacteroidota bacterium]MCZ2132344.1 hypothetical protein [Bacteroidota bacterium]
MKQSYALIAIFYIFSAAVCLAQYKPLAYKFEAGQRVTVKIDIEASGEKRTGLIPITVDSIDERGGAHLTVLPAEYGEYLGGLRFNAILTPRGQIRVPPHESPQDEEIMQAVKKDTVYRGVWGNDASALAYQFLFPYLPRPVNIAAALDTVQSASYSRRAILSDNEEDPGTDVVATHYVQTRCHRSKSFVYRGEKMYKLTRIENETEENCLQRDTYKFWRAVSNVEWIVRDRDGAVMQIKMITYKTSPDDSWQGITLEFNTTDDFNH